MASFGLSFMPGAQSGDDDERQGAPINQVQQAIKLLSFRLPRVMGGSALAPAPLLQGQGGMGSPFARSALFQTQQQQAAAPVLPPSPGGGRNPMAEAFLRMAGMGPQMMPSRNTPMMPRVIPGLTSNDPAVLQTEQDLMNAYYGTGQPYDPAYGPDHPKFGIADPGAAGAWAPPAGAYPGPTSPPNYPVGYEGQIGSQGYRPARLSRWQDKYAFEDTGNRFMP